MRLIACILLRPCVSGCQFICCSYLLSGLLLLQNLVSVVSVTTLEVCYFSAFFSQPVPTFVFVQTSSSLIVSLYVFFLLSLWIFCEGRMQPGWDCGERTILVGLSHGNARLPWLWCPVKSDAKGACLHWSDSSSRDLKRVEQGGFGFEVLQGVWVNTML